MDLIFLETRAEFTSRAENGTATDSFTVYMTVFLRTIFCSIFSVLVAPSIVALHACTAYTLAITRDIFD